MPQFLSFGSLRASTKVSGNGVPASPNPGDVTQIGYDDSNWPFSVVPSTAIDPGEFNAIGIESCAPTFQIPTTTTSIASRTHFTVPALPFQPYLLAIHSAVGALHVDITINGVTINPVTVTSLGLIFLVPSFGIIPLLVPGSDCLIVMRGALWEAGSGPMDAWLAWRMVFFVPDTGGKVYSWGTVTPSVNDKGFLGVGDSVTHLTPTPVNTTNIAENIVKIASNGKTTLFLDSDGSIWGCGDNSTGMALANGTTDLLAHPTPVIISSFAPTALINSANRPRSGWPWSDISIGDDCALAITRGGDVYGWGPNLFGSLGIGDTSPRLIFTFLTDNSATFHWIGFPGIAGNEYARFISCGKDFAVLAGFTTSASAGNNTFGQLGNGTTTASSIAVGGIGLGLNSFRTALSAGDAQVISVDSAGFPVHVVGRADHGSLFSQAFTAGTGPNKIVSTSLNVTTITFGGDVRQAGPITYFTGNLVSTTNPQLLATAGDGVPFGGSADNLGNFIYGQSSGAGIESTKLQPGASPEMLLLQPPPFGLAALQIVKLADISGGSQNPWITGNSKAVFAAIVGFINPQHPKLYTWGWGGAGQMGSGADPTTNLVAVSINGLNDVVGATVCAAGMFAIVGGASAVDAFLLSLTQVIG